MYLLLIYTVVPVMSRYYAEPLCNFIFIARNVETSTIGFFAECQESHIIRMIRHCHIVYHKNVFGIYYKK